MTPHYIIKAFTLHLLAIYICLSDMITLNTLLLNQYGIKNQDKKWNNLRQALALPKYDTIKIKDNIVTLEGLQKLFSENLTNIKNFFISQTSLDLKAIQYLMTNDRTFQFQKLSLMNSNFLCQDFSYLVERNTKITSLFLNQNRISKKGFQYLSKLKMNLSDLSLSSNSLVSDQAVDSVISFGLKQIINISLSHTSISGDNVIKLLHNMDLKKLRILDLNQNQFSTKFYQEFSKFCFQSLIQLNLGDLNIDEEGFSFLKNMHFPSLQSILLHGNQLNDQLGIQFITKKNMPKLKITTLGKYLLIEDNNFVTSVFFRHLKNEGFKFEQFSCKIKKIDQDALSQVPSMDTSELKMFLFSSLSTTPQIMSKLISQTNFTKLQTLELRGMNNKGDYFHDIMKVRWPKLKNLVLDSISYINETIYQGRAIFPELKLMSLSIDLQSFDSEVSIVNFVKNVQKIAPKLQQLYLSMIVSTQLIGSIFNGSLTNSLTRSLQLTINSNFPVQSIFSLILHPTEQAKILKLNLSPVFINFLGDTALKFFSQLSQSSLNIQQIIKQEGDFTDLFDLRTHITKFQNNLHKNFNFSELQQLYETVQLNFIRKLLAKNPNYVFQHLQVLELQFEENTQFQLLQFVQFPKLNTLDLISVEQISDDSSQFLLECLNKKFTHIHTLNLQLPINKRFVLKFLKDGQFGNLRKIQINMRGLLPQDFVEMQSYIKFQRLQSIYAFKEAFINKNLKFLGDSGARLVDLEFHNIIFNPGVLVQLCALNFQFMQIIEFSICGINDKDFMELINCIREKHPNEQNIFLPKARIINLQNNYISSPTLSKWMDLGLPLLTSMKIDQNMDGQKFNSVFLSPYSKRLDMFNLDSSKINGIDPSIDKRNFRRLQIFLIDSIKLFDADIRLISQYQFFSLLSVGIGLKKVDNCQVLKSLNKLINNVVSVAIQIEDSPMLSSDCMEDVEQSKNQITISELIIKGNSYYGQISEFVRFLLNKTANLTNIELIQTYMKEDDKVSQLIHGINEKKLFDIKFVSCFLDNNSAKKIFTKNLEEIRVITLSNNQFSSEGLSTLQNKKLKQLISLDLTETNIGDEGIEYLTTNQFPKLNQLLLKNSELTVRGIELLNNLKAKKLSVLDLSDNQLTVDDVMKLNPKTFPFLRKIILYPELGKLDYERLMKHFGKNTDSIFFSSVTIDTDVKDLYSYYQQEQYYGYYDDEEQKNEQLAQ